MTVDMEGTINPCLIKGNNYEGGDITGIVDTIAGLTRLKSVLLSSIKVSSYNITL